jgi:protease PrsW
MNGETARRWAWLAVLVIGVLLFETVRETMVATGNEALGPTLVLLGALVMPAAFLTFVAGRRMQVSVGAGMLALVALGGGVVGVVVAGFIEFETLQALGTAAKLGVAVIEELAKLLVPAALLFTRRPWRVADGLLLGVASGAGFAALETMGYAFTSVVNHHGDLTTVSNLLLVRGLWSPAGHMAWTGIAAAALYYAAEQRFELRACGLLAGALVMAIGLHTAWDSLQTPWAYAMIAVIGLGVLATVVHRVVHRVVRQKSCSGVSASSLTDQSLTPNSL